MSINPFNPRDPKKDECGLYSGTAFLSATPSSYIPAKWESCLQCGIKILPIEPAYSPFYLGDAPLMARTCIYDRNPPFYDHEGVTIATPCVSPYDWSQEDSTKRITILDVITESNPGLFLSSMSMRYYGERRTVSAKQIQAGVFYKIEVPANTDWIAIGAPDNRKGTEFIAQGPGTGGGSASYSETKYDDVKGIGFRWTYGPDSANIYGAKTIKIGSKYKIDSPGILKETDVKIDEIQSGWWCKIKESGDSNWLLIGAPSNDAGTEFKATGAGTGTGIAIHMDISTDFTTIGAADNKTGTEFVATGDGYGKGTISIIWLKAEHCVVGRFYKINTEGTTNWLAMGAPDLPPGSYSGVEFKCTTVGSGTGLVYVLNPATPHPKLRKKQTRYPGLHGSAVGTEFKGVAFLPGDPGKFTSGNLVICAYRYGFLLSERKEWRITVKIGKATVKWTPSNRLLKLTCGTKDAQIYYSTDGTTPSILYETPIIINKSTIVRWIAKKRFMEDSDEWQTEITYTKGSPPVYFETVLYSTLSPVDNSSIDVMSRMQRQASLYVSASGTGEGEDPSTPMSLKNSVGLSEVAATAIESNLVYRIVRRKKADGTGTETDFTLIGSPNNDIGTEFFATGAGSGDGAADLVGKARGPRTVTATQITSASLLATKTKSGKRYRIKSIGTTNWTLIGAASNTIGLEFDAIGTGSGTGTADQIVPVGTLQLMRDGSEPAGCQVGTVQAEEIIKDRWYQIKTLGDTDWTGYGAPCNAVGVEFVASVTGGTGTGTATEIGAIEISIEADEVAASALVEGDRCAVKEIGNTNWVAIGASANVVGIEFMALGAGTGTGKAWRRKWQHYTEPIEAGPCNIWIRRLRRTTGTTGESPYSRDFVLPWFYGDVDIKTSWNQTTKLLTLSVEPAYQLDAQEIDFTYGVDSSDENIYTEPIKITKPVTYKITIWHFSDDIPHGVDTYSLDEIEVTIDPNGTADFERTDTFTLTDESYVDQIFTQPADVLWLAEGSYTDAVYSNQAIVIRGGYKYDYTERDIRNRKTLLDSCKLGRKTIGSGTPVGVLDGVWASGNTTKDYWLGAATIYCCQAKFNKSFTENRDQILFDGDCYGCQVDTVYTGYSEIDVVLCSGEATDCGFIATVTSSNGTDRDNRDSSASLTIASVVRGTLDLTVTSGDGWGGVPPFLLEGNGGNSEATINASCSGSVIGKVKCTSGNGGDGYPTWDIGYGGASLATVDMGKAEVGSEWDITIVSGSGGDSKFLGAYDWGGDSVAQLALDAYRGSRVKAKITSGDGGDGGSVEWSEAGISYAKLISYVCHPTMTAILSYRSQGGGIDRELTGAEWDQPYEPTYIDPLLLDVRGMNLRDGNYKHPNAYTRPSGTTWVGWYSGTPNGDGAPLRGFENKQGTGIVLGRYWE